jgi:uncharacterized membrane protein YraQ (UPF0718 family)
MENPKIVGYFLLTLIVLLGIVFLIVSIHINDFSFFLYYFAFLGIFFILCLICGLVNVAVFGPILWLLARITGKKYPEISEEQKPKSANKLVR